MPEKKFARKKWGLFDPSSLEPHKVSRSKIDMFLECPRCFYLDQRLGVKRPSMPAFSLNSAVDALLKNEFDILRGKKQSHALMEKFGVDALPYQHPDLPKWRGEVNRFSGALVLDESSNLFVDGLIDDVWVNKKGELMLVDYKSTSTTKAISLDDEYKQGYKIQMEIYQWIFRKLGFNVSKTGYFVFANAGKDRESFDGRLEFEMSIVSYDGDDSWVAKTLLAIRKCLADDKIPEAGTDCEHCAYRQMAGEAIREVFGNNQSATKVKKVPTKKGALPVDKTNPLF
ncbi:MAG: PD-(D/E)XK nuclease family protein [Candidatus Uhrbacteria bacterium]|nr:PD-(D/E)XK nuclease family protein [Candidatus Uhrbacteria bacterium]